LPAVLYGCETLSQTLREELRVLKRIFGPKRDELIGWRKLHNEELHNLCSLLSIIRMFQVKENEMNKACSTYGEDIGF
jgi:hypothetical protein